ncbi:MAG: TolB family protein [Anaerolineales bacterium]
MSRRMLFLMMLIFGLLGNHACSPAAGTTRADGLSTVVSATLEASASATAIPKTPTATNPAAEPTLWMNYEAGGNQIWVLGDGQPYQRTLPVSIGEYFGYAPASNRILMAAHWGDHGAGPGNVSVSDLSILDLNSGQVTTLLPDNIVEAQFAPDGEAIAYILATPSTYELHWRDGEGSDRILASDVTFTWAISPDGGAVAFTRETGYELDIIPGLYVVQVASGQEIQLSNIDKSGTGSTADLPFWSPDSSQVILSHYGGPGARLVWARSDGRAAFDLGVETEPDVIRTDLAIPFLLWYPDSEHLLRVESAEVGEDPMSVGPYPIVRYRLDPASMALVEPTPVGETFNVIDWAVPGYSVWVFENGEISEYVLPD